MTIGKMDSLSSSDDVGMITPNQPEDMIFQTRPYTDSIASIDRLLLIKELYCEILGKFDDFLIITDEEGTDIAEAIRKRLQAFLVSVKDRLEIRTQVTSLEWDLISFEFDSIQAGMSEEKAKKLWNNDEDEWWNDL